MQRITKAVFPAAGLGTRFLPATKALPKEMLPIIDRPLIQYAMEEVSRSGIHEVIIVTGRGKAAIEDHFDESFELERLLEARHRSDLLETVRAIARLTDISYVRQGEALGLGHAILRARHQVGDEPFAAILADDLIDSRVPCTRQLLEVFEQVQSPVIALMDVEPSEVASYGIVRGEPVSASMPGLFRITDLVEKPSVDKAPSNMAVIGRYILTPDIFAALESVVPGYGGEIQLTDALKLLLSRRNIYGLKFSGTRYDAGGKLGFLIATLAFGMRRADVGRPLLDYLKTHLQEFEQIVRGRSDPER